MARFIIVISSAPMGPACAVPPLQMAGTARAVEAWSPLEEVTSLRRPAVAAASDMSTHRLLIQTRVRVSPALQLLHDEHRDHQQGALPQGCPPSPPASLHLGCAAQVSAPHDGPPTLTVNNIVEVSATPLITVQFRTAATTAHLQELHRKDYQEPGRVERKKVGIYLLVPWVTSKFLHITPHHGSNVAGAAQGGRSKNVLREDPTAPTGLPRHAAATDRGRFQGAQPPPAGGIGRQVHQHSSSGPRHVQGVGTEVTGGMNRHSATKIRAPD